MIRTLADEFPTARQAHRCGACDGTIAVGDTYHRQRNVDGGDAWVWKAHLLCSRIYMLIIREYGLLDDEQPDPAEVHELLENRIAALFQLEVPEP